jgi:hypothetical protein
MHPILFLTATVLIFLINGLPIVLASSPRLSYRNVLPAPVIGASLLSILVTVFYVWSVASYAAALASTALTAILSIILIARRSKLRAGTALTPKRIQRIRVISCLMVAALLVLPHLLGGQQFALFQANRFDSLNYLSAAAGFSVRSYSELRAFDIHAEPVATLAMAAEMLSQRPAVALLYASFSRLFSTDVLVNAYDYCLAAELNLYFALLYLLLNLFPAREKYAHVVSAAFIVGFFGQYLIDINAWSALFAISMLVVLVTDYCISIQPAGTPAPQPAPHLFLLLRMPVLAAGMIYMYPEITPIAAMACGGALLAGLIARRDEARRIRLGLFRQNIVLGSVTLAVVGFSWSPTIGFFLRQARIATSDLVDWQLFFQAYLLDGSEKLIAAADLPHPAYVPIVISANFLAGLFGLYFIQPGARLDGFHVIWSAGLIIAVAVVGFGIVTAARRELKRGVGRPAPALFAAFLGGALLTTAAPIALLLKGQYWAAGKGLAIISPFVFVLMVLPLFCGKRKPLVAALVWMIVGGHLMFGVFRPIAVAAHSDRHNYAYPYPSAPKDDVNWNIDRYRAQIEHCRLARIDVDNPFLDRVAEIYLIEHNINFFSLNPRNAYYGLGADLGLKQAPNGEKEDCTISSHIGTSSAQMTWLQISR